MNTQIKSLTQILPKREKKGHKFERALFVGKTGSGKTYLAQQVLKHYPHVVIYDPKCMIEDKDYVRVRTFKEAERAGNRMYGQRTSRILYAPNAAEHPYATPVYFDVFCHWIYERKNCVLYIDEVYAITKNANTIPYWYLALLSQGRGLGISVFQASQRPTNIPSYILTESENYYAFFLKKESDRDRIEELSGIDTDSIKGLETREYRFYYSRDNVSGFSGPFLI
jgi:ATPase family associated with various cellular activities (AAA)